MHPFRITCPGCGGRLVIRTPQWLGRSVRCPRCQNSVAVPNAEEYAAAAQQHFAVDSQALTAVDLAPPVAAGDTDTAASEKAWQPAEQTPTVENSPPLTDGASGSVADFELPEDFDEVSQHLAATVSGSGSMPDLPAEIEDSPTLAGDHIEPAGDAGWRPIAAIAAGVCGLCVVALLSFLWWAGRDDASVSAAPADLQQDDADANPQAANNFADTGVPAAPSPPSESSIAVEGQSADPSDATRDSGNSKAADTGPSTAVAAAEQPAAATSESGVEGDPSTVNPSVGNPSTAETPDPLMAFLTNSSPDAILASPNATADAGGTAGRPVGGELPESMRQFAPIFDLSAMPTMSDAQSLAPEDSDLAGLQPPPVDLGSLYHPTPQPLPVWTDVRTQMVPAIEISDRPLLTTLATLDAIWMCPIGWDLPAVRWDPRPLDMTVSIDAKQISLQQLYDQLLEPIELKLQARSGELPVITTADDAIAEVPAIDLVEIEPNAAQEQLLVWQRFFEQLLPTASGAWVLDGTRLTPPDELSPENRNLILDLQAQIAAWQQCRREGKETIELPVHQRYREVREQLGRTGARWAGPRASSIVLLQQAAEELDLQLLIDWPGCWGHGLTPQASMSVITAGRTLPQIAKFLADEYLLVLAVDPQGRLILTTTERQRLGRRWLLLPMQEGEDIATIRRRLSLLTPIDSEQRSILQVLPFPADPENWVAALLCDPSVGQLETLIDWLPAAGQ